MNPDKRDTFRQVLQIPQMLTIPCMVSRCTASAIGEMASALPVISPASPALVVNAAAHSLPKTAVFQATRRSVPDIGGLSRSYVMRSGATKSTSGIARHGTYGLRRN